MVVSPWDTWLPSGISGESKVSISKNTVASMSIWASRCLRAVTSPGLTQPVNTLSLPFGSVFSAKYFTKSSTVMSYPETMLPTKLGVWMGMRCTSRSGYFSGSSSALSLRTTPSMSSPMTSVRQVEMMGTTFTCG